MVIVKFIGFLFYTNSGELRKIKRLTDLVIDETFKNYQIYGTMFK